MFNHVIIHEKNKSLNTPHLAAVGDRGIKDCTLCIYFSTRRVYLEFLI